MDDSVGILRQMLQAHAKHAEEADGIGSNNAAWHRNRCRALQAAIDALETSPAHTSEDRKPDPEKVICPNCTHQFHAISERDQQRMRAHTSEARDVELVAADGCFEAALVEGWIDALANGDIELIRDLWNRRISIAREHIVAAMRQEAGSRD